jgi:uncharacterized membrane protein
MNKELVGSLSWGIGIVVLALVATYARKLGYMDSETVTRLVVGANGLMIAWFGNRMPKTFVPAAWARELRRVAGWSLFVSGLIYAALWAFAPTSVAIVGGCAAVAAGIAVTIGYCLSLRARARAAG